VKSTRLAVIGSFALLLAALISPRSGGGAPPPSDPYPLPADTMHYSGAEIGVRGGRFVLAQTGGPRTFNPMMSNEQSSNDVNNLLWGSLVDYDYVSRGAMPALAKSWEVSRDSTTYTWHMRRGARFSDGAPITSADVMFSVQVAMDSVLHPAVQDLLTIEGSRLVFSAPDSYTVVTRVARPYGLTIWSIASLRILPRHRMEAAYRAGSYGSVYNVSTAPESLVTSGPWRLQQYTPGEKTVLARNPYWYRVDDKGQRLPYLDQIVFLIVPDQTAAALKFQAGEVDAVENVKPEDYKTYADGQKQGDYTLFDVGPSLSTNFIWFNLNTVKESGKSKPPGSTYVDPVKYAWFNQADFRRAISKALDRDAMIRGPFFGEGAKCWSTITPGNPLWYSSDFKGDDFDPEGAKKLLASLGMKDRDGDGVLEDAQGHPVTFSIKTNAENDLRKNVLSMIQSDLAKVGIRVTPAPTPFNVLTGNLRTDFDYDAIFLGLGSGVPPDPGMSANVYRASGLTHFWNIKQRAPDNADEARLDALANVLARSGDQAARHRAFAEIQRIMADKNWFVFLPVANIKIPVRNKFGNARPQIVPHRVLWNSERMFVRRPARSS
jgi:peptide/nickel transport system substrate-binding protein